VLCCVSLSFPKRCSAPSNHIWKLRGQHRRFHTASTRSSLPYASSLAPLKSLTENHGRLIVGREAQEISSHGPVASQMSAKTESGFRATSDEAAPLPSITLNTPLSGDTRTSSRTFDLHADTYHPLLCITNSSTHPSTTMPGKHVRFSNTYLAYSPDPARHSDLSNGPITPPQRPTMRLPYPSVPSYMPHKPSHLQYPVMRVQPHPLLAFHHHPMVIYDVSLHPSSAIATRGHTHAVLAESAMIPPVPFLTIISPYLRWSISVVPSPHQRAFVSVSDVLEAIYHGLRHLFTEHEYLHLSRGEQKAIRASYKRRYGRIPERRHAEKERLGGLKRVDFLMGRTRFLGLSPSTDGPDVWVLHVG
jgi:hypothetical protein